MVAAERPRQQQRLHSGNQSPRDLFSQKGMLDGLLLALLPRFKKGAATLVGQEDSAVFLLLKMLAGDHLLVDAR